MLASYTFNTTYTPSSETWQHFPSLRLLEGGRFSPDQYGPVLVWEYQQIRLKYYRWGMVSAWNKRGEENKGKKFAPIEQVFSHPRFQLPLRRNRCLIPADGYYIDTKGRNGKETFKASMPEGEGFCFAGIFDAWRQSDGSTLYSFAILTQASGENDIHLRKPLILPKNVESTWLNPYTNMNKVQKILQLPARGGLKFQEVHELNIQELPSIGQVAA
ncbi:MAG: SOS response-associated peptidase family protein [Bacteroidota bacterium]